MRSVADALEPLGPDERGRVLRWAAERFDVPLRSNGASGHKGAPNREERGRSAAVNIPQDLGEFYSQASPDTEPERTLVVAYWVQEVRGDGEFDSQSVNKELKHLGHGVSNITRAFDDLKARRPQFVIQTQKSGTAKQARKRYKVTAAGKAEVQRMLSRQPQE